MKYVLENNNTITLNLEMLNVQYKNIINIKTDFKNNIF